MSLIQITLISAALLSFFVYLKHFRSLLRDRLLALLFLALQVLAVIFPNFTQTVAQFLGVGRGTDLVFYLFAMGTVFLLVILYSRIHRSEAMMTELVRAMALQDVKTSK